ncbi:hypothetical protein PED39_04175 [Methanomassiliicoccales archaeon LGM-RCC1]|nr:hypothetical protein PED39_04175 [Methanomassiliicoccales archaeon LGM-RCC1]
MIDFIQDIQSSCVNQSDDVIALLRKAYIVARKLSQSEFQSWIDNELKGYPSTDKVPQYRKVSGMIYARWISGNYIPVQLDDESTKRLTRRSITHSIPEIISLLDNNKQQYFELPFMGDINQAIGVLTGHEAQYYLFVGKDQFQGIIEEVINTILRWSFTIEENGTKECQLPDLIVNKEDGKNQSESNCVPSLIFNNEVASVQIQVNSSNSCQKTGKED